MNAAQLQKMQRQMQGQSRNPPVIVLNTMQKREHGREAQLGNIAAAKAVSEILRTCLGPRAMLKMLLNPMGGVALTNDGNAILRELNVSHPAAKSVVELARTQDDEVGDGTTSVIILTGELLTLVAPWLERNVHPTVLVRALFQARDDALALMKEHSRVVDENNREELLRVVRASLGTKFVARWSDLMTGMAVDAVRTVALTRADGSREIDIKRFVRVEKIPGAEVTDSRVIRGVILNKDITHPSMRRKIVNPRVILLDTGIEYKKGENQTMVEAMKEGDFERLLQIEEESIQAMVNNILKHKPDLVITEKGLDERAQHFFVKAGVTALRRLRKTDNNRLARVTGATICSRAEEIKESDVGTKCGLFEIEKIGDEYFSFIVAKDDAEVHACSILLRGASKDVLNEVERNLNDAMFVCRNVMREGRLVPGGGAIEMSVSHGLLERAKAVEGVGQWPYKAVALALEVIPRTLAQNCGSNSVRLITQLRAKHAAEEAAARTWGVDGNKGELCDVTSLGLWEPMAVRAQTIKTAVEAAAMLLRVDDILSGGKPKGDKGGAGGGPQMQQPGGGEEDAGAGMMEEQ